MCSVDDEEEYIDYEYWESHDDDWCCIILVRRIARKLIGRDKVKHLTKYLRKCFSIVKTLAEMGLHVTFYILDYMLLAEYYHSRDDYWFWLTFTFTIPPAFLTSIISCYVARKDIQEAEKEDEERRQEGKCIRDC